MQFFRLKLTIRSIVIAGMLTTIGVVSATSPASSQGTRASHRSGSGTSSGSSASDLITGMSDPDLLGESLSLQQSQLADMKTNLHITTVRIGVIWEYVQYEGPTSFDWSLYDQLIGAIRADGLSLDLIIGATASWASASGDINAQPSNPAQFAAFAADVASRYGSGGPTTYEIWNEPNNVNFWTPAPNAAAYTTLLIDSYNAIKAVQPNEMVISGGLAPEANDGTNIAPITFLQAMYADGAKGHFNAVGYHPYSYQALPDTFESWSGWSQMSATNPSIRSVMAANGDSAKQVWITEVGWPSNTASITGVNGLTAQGDEITQIQSFAQANSWVGPIYLYTYQDDSSGPFGVITSTGAKKPSYAVLASL
jgi:polysaccharide biosynthesis protein PslG